MNKNNKKGFTLAELLIVVAIIGGLVAVSFPIFTAQLKKARLATNQAIARGAKAAAVSEYLIMDTPAAMSYTYDVGTGTKATNAVTDATSVGTSNLDISAWTVDNMEALTTDTYDTWVIAVGADGAVTDISYK